MSAQPKYVMQPDFDHALTAFFGYVDHIVSMTKAEIRREIIGCEDRLVAKIETIKTDLQAEIRASEARLQTQITSMQTQITSMQTDITSMQTEIKEMKAEITDMQSRFDRVETMGKANHQMLQIMLDQFSKINKKLGID